MSYCECCQGRSRRPLGLFSVLFNVLLLWVILVVGGGTLIKTGHPVAVEVGEWMHLVTFVDPTVYWAENHGYDPLATTVRFLSAGIPGIPSVS